MGDRAPTIGFTDNCIERLLLTIVGKLRAFQANVLDATVVTITNYLAESAGIFATATDTKARQCTQS
jgi:hypothetical protein